MSPGWRFARSRVTPPVRSRVPDWQQANPKAIGRALDRALALPTGGWYVLDATRRIGRVPRAFVVAGRSLVAWRDGNGLHVAPESCPHMGASLAGARVCDGRLVCPWHGLALGPEGRGAWQPLPAHDDRELAWVRLDDDDPTDAPCLPDRPERAIAGTIRVEAGCDPEDVLANRLDPWHGAHFHPYSFGALEVLDESDTVLTVRVEKKILGPVRVEIDATFHCTDARTIVMTIVAGEGAGSVVETHATPIGPGRTAVVEATFATSDRAGFRIVRRLGRLVRPFIERAAKRLWVDDAAYAERLYALREARDGEPRPPR